MTAMKDLLKLDVTIGMEKDIKVLLGAIDTIDISKKSEAKGALEQIHKKVVEIEEYFWRPIDSPEVYEKLKAIALELGDKSKANKYESKIKLFEANELEFKGRVQDFYGNKVKAIEYYSEALRFVPDHELAHPAHEKALKTVDKAKKEIGQAEKKLQTSPNDPKLWFKYGVAHLNVGKVDKAIEYLDKAIGLNPSDPDALARRGTAMESLGDYQGAKKYLEKALEIKPNSLTAKRGMTYAEYFLEQR